MRTDYFFGLSLLNRYGGGPEIKRQVVRSGVKLVIDLYPVNVVVEYEERAKGPISIPLSGSNLMRMVRHWAATAANMAPHRCELFLVLKNEEGKEERKPLSADDLKKTLEEFGATDTLNIYLLSASLESNSSSYTGYGSGFGGSFHSFRPPENERGTSPARGAVGKRMVNDSWY